MQTSQAMMGAVHGSAALHRIAEAIAVSASEEPAGTVKLCNLPAAIHLVGTDAADEPWPLTAQAAGNPANRHALVDGLPFLAV